MNIIYTTQKSKISKKQRERQAKLLAEQRAIKKSLKSTKSLSIKYDNYRSQEIQSSKLVTVGSALKKEQLYYTGSNMIGIGTLHKSNAVPIFKVEEAKEISAMRR